MKLTTPLLLSFILLFTACGNETRYTYYPNGGLKTKATYNSENQLDGEYLSYHETGGISTKENYENGKLDGKFFAYYTTGEVKFEREYSDGRCISW